MKKIRTRLKQNVRALEQRIEKRGYRFPFRFYRLLGPREYLALLRLTSHFMHTPPRILQRAAARHLSRHFKYLINRPDRSVHLNEKQVREYLAILKLIYSHIDDTVLGNLERMPEQHRCGVLAVFKEQRSAGSFVVLRQYDPAAEALQVSYFTGGDSDTDVCALVDGHSAEKLDRSHTVAWFLDRPFFTEHRFWIRANENAIIQIEIAGQSAKLKGCDRPLANSLSVKDIITNLRPKPPNETRLSREALRIRTYVSSLAAQNRFAGCWVLMDRDDVADDNAEHFYRYLQQNRKADKAFFVLREDSRDWKRLEAEGFQLLAFGSDDHIAALANSAFLISSQASPFVLWPIRKSWIQDLASYQFIFLQHGVIHNDSSKWLNGKPIRIFVTSAEREYNDISQDNGRYLFTTREVKKLGLPRHDTLLSIEKRADIILIIPTWRSYLVGKQRGNGSARHHDNGFSETAYAQNWKALLHSEKLRIAAERYNKNIVFAPHPSMSMYLNSFDVPDHIYVRDAEPETSFLHLFAKTAVLITDYSSVAFDVAYADKPVVYYQFDSKEFYSKNHLNKKGYFDYDRDGFGPVAATVDQVLDATLKALEGKDGRPYVERRETFFAFRDGRCCERLYREILALHPDQAREPAGEFQSPRENQANLN